MPIDFKRTDTGDISIDSGAMSLVDGRDAAAQSLAARLMSFTNEWFMNLEYGGIDKNVMFSKNPDLTEFTALRKSAISDVPGVVSILSYRVSLDATTRNLVEVIGVSTETSSVLEVVLTSESSGGATLTILGDHGGIA